MEMLEFKEGMCISCLKEKITRHGLFCADCAEPYDDISGDNEQKHPERITCDFYSDKIPY